MLKHVTVSDNDIVKDMVGLIPGQSAASRAPTMTAINRATGAIGTHSLNQNEWRKAAKFTSTKVTTAVMGTVRSTTGYVRIVNCNGVRTTLGAGTPASNISVNFGTPTAGYNNLLPKFYAIFPCNSSGLVQVNEHLTLLSLGNNQLTSFDGAGLSSLTNLTLFNNQLTSFDGTGLGALTYLDLISNQLTSFDGTGLGALTELRLSSNQLTSFDGTGLGALTELTLFNNQLTSFDGTGLGALGSLSLGNNQLTSFDGAGLSSLTNLTLFNNQLTSFDGTGLGALGYLDLNGNQLTSFDGTGLGALTGLDIYNNQLTSFNGTGLSLLTFLYLSSNQLTSFDGTGLGALTDLDLFDNQLTSVLLPDFTGTQPYTWTTYNLDLSNQQMTTDAVYAMLDSILTPALSPPYPINLVGNPCDAGAGPALVEDGIHTQAEVEALLTAKGYSLQLTGGTIAP